MYENALAFLINIKFHRRGRNREFSSKIDGKSGGHNQKPFSTALKNRRNSISKQKLNLSDQTWSIDSAAGWGWTVVAIGWPGFWERSNQHSHCDSNLLKQQNKSFEHPTYPFFCKEEVTMPDSKLWVPCLGTTHSSDDTNCGSGRQASKEKPLKCCTMADMW